MTAAPAPEVPRQRWRGVVLALIAFAVLSSLPLLNVHAPISDWHVFLITLLAACAVIGWLRNGKFLNAALWLLAAVLVFSPGGRGAADAYFWLERGWILLVAGIFGLTVVLATTQSFFVRAMIAVTASFVVALTALGAHSGSFERLQVIVSGEFVTRNQATLETLESSTDALLQSGSASESLSESLAETKERMRVAPQVSSLLAPSLLALQSLAALALAWAMYHRLSRVRIGPALAPLRNFRFNDQLVWGLAVGLTILLLPAFQEARGIGLNLVVFFAVLYFVRGLGVLAWVTKGGVFVVLAVLLSLFPPALGAIGLSDTWLDWRSRAKAV